MSIIPFKNNTTFMVVIHYIHFPYSWCNQVLWLLQMVWKNTSRRWDLWLEVGPTIGGEISNRRWHLWSEVTPPIGGGTSDYRLDLQLEVRSPIGGVTSNWRWDLQLEAPMLHVGISYSFEKKRDYLLLITSSRHLSTRWNVNLLFQCMQKCHLNCTLLIQH